MPSRGLYNPYHPLQGTRIIHWQVALRVRYSDFSPLSVVLMSLVPSTKVHAWGGECREQLCSAIVRISDRLQFLIPRGWIGFAVFAGGSEPQRWPPPSRGPWPFCCFKVDERWDFFKKYAPSQQWPAPSWLRPGDEGFDIFSRIHYFDWWLIGIILLKPVCFFCLP